MKLQKLTEEQYWDDYWTNLSLPSEIKRTKKSYYLNEILNVFDKYFHYDPSLSILEIGGSPGQYLAYLHRNFGYKIHCLDYSEIGCLKTEENFRLLNIPCNIIRKDLFKEENETPLFDIVYSLGFVEHFEDIDFVIERHMKFLKKDGLLLFGMPNFTGINYLFLKVLAPELLKKHNIKVMDIASWNVFEQKLNLQKIFKGYIGGFEPSVFNRREKNTSFTLVVKVMAKFLSVMFTNHFNFLRKYNSKYFSGYIIGVYKK
jgi:2-polyprenyl-3-methyl-5-hydroxy-6-metoxy-1,4-benzoquinol methylase